MRSLVGIYLATNLMILAGCATPPAHDAAASGGASTGADWPTYAGDPGSQKYSPLAQINATNVEDLEIAWVWASPDNITLKNMRTANPAARVDNFKGTPLMVDGRLFIRTQLGAVQALNPATGAPIWTYAPDGYKAGQPKSYGFTTRGVAYWKDPASGEARILSTTPDRTLVALDANTGDPVSGFGDRGIVNLDASLRRVGQDPSYMNYGNQVPVIVGDVLVLGSVVTDAEAAYLKKDKTALPDIPVGDVRGFDVRTGKLLWTFHTVPHAGEFGADTWEDESWKWVGSTNVWSLMSADPELGYVYLPVTGPTFNYYGGFRKGDNLYGDSLVCLDAKTGKRVWHFQATRHPIFDYDMPAAPVLADIRVDGKPVKAVVTMTKAGYVFVLDRVTGEPVWPIEERPVPASAIEGERAAATQPVPTRPAPIAQQGIGPDSINRLTPELERKSLALLERYDHGPIYTPITERGVIFSPGISGGPNWPGGAVDPETGRFYVTAINQPMVRGLSKADNAYGYVFRQIGDGMGGVSFAAPPWGTLTAIDLNTGATDWRVANGPGPKLHPDLASLGLQDLGTPSKSNVLATKSLLFAATSGRMTFGPAPQRKDMRIAPGLPESTIEALKLDSRAMLRAFDKATGAVVWSHPIGPSFNDGGAPMTYLWQGRQYLVTPVGGGDADSFLIAFALPKSAKPADASARH